MGHPKFVISPRQLNSLVSISFPEHAQLAEIYILSQPLMVRIMATEPPVISLLPGNFTLDIPASIIILTQAENSTAETIVSMDFVSLWGQAGSLWIPILFPQQTSDQQWSAKCLEGWDVIRQSEVSRGLRLEWAREGRPVLMPHTL